MFTIMIDIGLRCGERMDLIYISVVERVVLSCGVRARGVLFYKVSAGSDFLSGSVKWCSFCGDGVVK